MRNTKIEFNTATYEFSHGKSPRGYGSWAFDWGTGPVFAPASTYTQARAWAREQVLAHLEGTGARFVVIEVCS